MWPMPGPSASVPKSYRTDRGRAMDVTQLARRLELIPDTMAEGVFTAYVAEMGTALMGKGGA